MNGFVMTSRRWAAAFALALLASTPAFADNYDIKLFQGTTFVGTGSFSFPRPGSSGPATVSLVTNGSSTIGAQTFISGQLSVNVVAVNYNDNKTSAKYGANQITGSYVEGLTDTLDTAPATGLTAKGFCATNPCFFRITFAFTPATNPASMLKTYQIELRSATDGSVISTVVPFTIGNYAVTNQLHAAPEPSSLALLATGFLALAWITVRRRQAGS